MNTRKVTWITAGILFAAASIWIHYEVKVKMLHRGGGSVRQLGTIKVDEMAPDFSARDLKGRDVVLSAFRDRKVVLLDFWATWCGQCRRAMPSLQTLHDESKDRGVELLSVNLGEEHAKVQHFIQRNDYTFRVVLDEDSTIGGKFGIRSIPSMVVVDKGGLVQWIHVGYQKELKELRSLLDRLTKEGGT